MNMKIGIDIVYIPKFEKTLKDNQVYFSQNVFCSKEWDDASIERLASIFATKEATMKALGIKSGRWLEICVEHTKNGKPFLSQFPQENNKQKKWSHELSISHDGEYVIANIVFY